MKEESEKSNYGGPRPGAGRDPMFNEPAARIIISIPGSKEKEIREKIDKILKKYRYKQKKKK
jgi:hypothetical protein